MPKKSKWRHFSNSNSPTIINQPHTGSSDVPGDWNRHINHEQVRITINGRPLAEYAKQYDDFKTMQALEKFFSEVILKDCASSNKAEAIAYLKTAFHQGGLLFSVSSALQTYFDLYSNLKMQDSTKHQNINIVTTNTGFKVQEFCEVGRMLKNGKHADPTIRPDKGHAYVLKAQGVIAVDFSNNASPPALIVESNTLDFGNQQIEKGMDNRTLGQMIVDFIKNALGINVVMDLSVDDKEDQEAHELRSVFGKR